jgi:hypothetical protein
MKKQLSESDFIGGEGSLTKEEEFALAQYFAKKKKIASEKKVTYSVKTKKDSLAAAVLNN